MSASTNDEGRHQPPRGLVVDQITVRFGDVAAVNDVSLEVPHGTTLALLGPSGCGKSTLLRVIAGLQRPTAGSVRFGGRELTSLAPHLRDVGLMFQSHALFPHRNVGDNVGFGLKMSGVGKGERGARVREMLGLVGLAGYEGRRVETLSGGEAQRVALARALAPRPGVLLLDEPLGSLDRILRERLADDLRHLLADLQQTAIHVTHDHEEAERIASAAAVMSAGQLLQVGSFAALRADPEDDVVGGLLGVSGDSSAGLDNPPER